MQTIHLQAIAIAYSVLAVCYVWYFMTLSFKNGGNISRRVIFNRLVGLRAKYWVLVPVIIFSLVAITSWVLLAAPVFDGVFLHTEIWFTYDQVKGLETLFDVIPPGKPSDLYWLIMFMTSVPYLKGFIILFDATTTLLDDSLVVDKYGNLKYKKD